MQKNITKPKNVQGFTIVELLIVIVVIGILAAITIVAFNGVSNRAKVAALQSELSGAAKKLELYKITPGGNDQYPADLATAGVTGTGMTYFPNGTSYCLVNINGANSYYVTNTSSKPQVGACMVSDQLVGWWTFDGNANDSSGNGINGTNSGATLTTGQDGTANSAYQFNGTSSSIALPYSSILNITDSYSLSAWIKLDAFNGTAGWNDIISGGAGDWSIGINSTSAGDGQLMLTKVNTGDGPPATTPVARQVWKHVLVTALGSTVRYYVDGQPNGQVVANFGGFTNTAAKRIGLRNTAGSAGTFRGTIDDVRVYNKVLSPSEIQIIYSGGAQ